MIETQGTFNGSGGVELFFQCWQPEIRPENVIEIVLGLDENCRHYNHLVDYFVAKGVGVYGYDLRGHGKSGGQEGHINHFSEYCEDLEFFLEQVNFMANHEQIFFILSQFGGHDRFGLFRASLKVHPWSSDQRRAF